MNHDSSKSFAQATSFSVVVVVVAIKVVMHDGSGGARQWLWCMSVVTVVRKLCVAMVKTTLTTGY
jgi:hypothetical protein